MTCARSRAAARTVATTEHGLPAPVRVQSSIAFSVPAEAGTPVGAARPRLGGRSLGPVIAALAGAVLSVSIAGCDTPEHQADKKVQADLAAAMAEQAHGDAAKARSALEKIAAETGGSPETRVMVKSALAESEQEAAAMRIQQLDEDLLAARQLIYQIDDLGGQVAATHDAMTAYDKYSPKPAQAAIASSIAAIQGSANAPTWTDGGGISIPTLSAVTQDISRLQGLIATQQDQIKSLQDRRTQLLNDAEAAARSADASKGQQSVDEYTRSSNLRKQAGDVLVQIDKAKADTQPLSAQLAVAQGQQTILQDAVKQLQDESDAMDAGWKTLTESLTAQSTLAKDITAAPDKTPLSSDGAANASGNVAGNVTGGLKSPMAVLFATAGASIDAKAEALGKLQDQIKQDRSQAETQLHNAIQHYGDAAAAASEIFSRQEQLVRDPNNATRPEQAAWKDLEATFNPSKYKLDAATAQRQLASMYSSEVFSLAARQRMQTSVAKSLTDAGLDVPPALSDTSLDEQRSAAVKSAQDAYAAADAAIGNLTTGTPASAPLPNLAKVEQILTLYGEVQLARETGDTATAQTKLQDALTARDSAIDAHLTLPTLPPELKPASASPAAPAAPASPASPTTSPAT